jgi:hypothetical protein
LVSSECPAKEIAVLLVDIAFMIYAAYFSTFLADALRLVLFQVFDQRITGVIYEFS